MSRPLIDVSLLRREATKWGGNEESLGRAIDAASATIERECGRLILATAAADQIHSGDRAARYRDENARTGTRLYLQDHATGYYTLPITAVASATEDGVALTVVRMPSAGPWADADNAVVILDRQGIAIRASISGGKVTPKPWAEGLANIRLGGVACGWASDAIPDDIAQVVLELALLYHRESSRAGADSMNVEGSSISYTRTLTPKARDVIALYSRRVGPRTLEG